MDRRARDGLLLEGDAQLAWLGADFLQERPRRRRCPLGIAGRRTAAGVKEGGAVADGAGEGMAAGEAAPAFAHIRAGGIASAAGLEPEEAAVGGRDTDRAAAIGAMGGRDRKSVV